MDKITELKFDADADGDKHCSIDSLPIEMRKIIYDDIAELFAQCDTEGCTSDVDEDGNIKVAVAQSDKLPISYMIARDIKGEKDLMAMCFMQVLKPGFDEVEGYMQFNIWQNRLEKLIE